MANNEKMKYWLTAPSSGNFIGKYGDLEAFRKMRNMMQQRKDKNELQPSNIRDLMDKAKNDDLRGLCELWALGYKWQDIQKAIPKDTSDEDIEDFLSKTMNLFAGLSRGAGCEKAKLFNGMTGKFRNKGGRRTHKRSNRKTKSRRSRK